MYQKPSIHEGSLLPPLSSALHLNTNTSAQIILEIHTTILSTTTLALQLFSFILLIVTLVVAAPVADISTNRTDMLTWPFDIHLRGCVMCSYHRSITETNKPKGWSYYYKFWHGEPEHSGENLMIKGCHNPSTPFRDYEIFENSKCMGYFYM